jgi:hypothetical protein
MDDERIYSALMLLGAVPFLACALLPAVGVDELGRLGMLDQLASSYGLAILCFLTGVHWATRLYNPVAGPINLFVGSNVVFLAVWIAYVSSSLKLALATQLLAFLLLLAVDVQLMRVGRISRHYLQMRFVATALACFSLLFILLS